jgi:sorbitol-specific phosphotransferase system component IIA
MNSIGQRDIFFKKVGSNQISAKLNFNQSGHHTLPYCHKMSELNSNGKREGLFSDQMVVFFGASGEEDLASVCND